MTALRPLVAIVGRPNVGKSTLFNRISQRRKAIVSDIPGTTRDRITADVNWRNRTFTLVDTGGLLPFDETEIWEKVKAQVYMAVEEADVIIMVVDANEGITSTDRDIADALRRTGKPLVLAANKSETKKRREQGLEFYELGIGEPMSISAYHGQGVEELLAEVAEHLPPEGPAPEPQEEMLKLAIVGRTNVGKSTLLNTILGQERAIVSAVPGTTRDVVDSVAMVGDRPVVIIDTAGMRRRGKVEPGIEKYSVLRTMRAIDRADVVILLLDTGELVTAQDTHVANYVLESYKGMVFAVNKWDKASEMGFTQADVIKEVRSRFRFVPQVPVSFVSALTGKGVPELLATAIDVYQQWSMEIPKDQLNKTMLMAIGEHMPTATRKGGFKVHKVVQEGIRPPTFVFYGSRASLVHFSYKRYLENELHKSFGLRGVRPRLLFRGKGGR